MASADSIAGFDDEGTRALLPIYRFNALVINRLAPMGAQLVDLGCGSARFLAYLAKHRPDLRILGLDLAEDMLSVGRRHLAAEGLDRQVRLLQGDMRDFRGLLRSPPNIVTSIFSMHHLTSRADLCASLHEIAGVGGGQDAALWIFDHTRPRRRETVEDVPEIFTPDASAAFCEDSRNSLRASWSFQELADALHETIPIGVHGAPSRFLPLYQVHWAGRPQHSREARRKWVEHGQAPRRVRVEAAVLAHLFATLPAGRAGSGGGVFESPFVG